MRTKAGRRLETEGLLRSAVDLGMLEVHYQPIVDLRSGATVGHEALARIRRADGSLVYPADFIAVAEDCGLIIPFGAAVLAAACGQQARSGPAVDGVHMAVNISARQLTSSSFVDDLAASLRLASLPPSSLCLELTESVLIETSTTVLNRLSEIKDLGVQLALDDFGTGWSSLAYLRRFPIDVVKIDRSFVADLGVDAGATELVRAIIGLGQALHLTTIAEGVETTLQHERLLELGCLQAQGYLYGRPEPVVNT